MIVSLFDGNFHCDICAIVINVVNGQGLAFAHRGREAMVWLDCGANITVLLFSALPPSREIRLTVI
jgi:hypothetical protein